MPLEHEVEKHADAGAKAKGFLTHKIGPLELWQWFAATAGLLLAIAAYRRQAGASAQSATVVPATPTGDATTGGGTDGPLTNASAAGQLETIQAELQTLAGNAPNVGATAGSTNTNTNPTGVSNGFSTEINDLYATLGRAPDTAGASYWQNQLGLEGFNQVFANFEQAAANNGELASVTANQQSTQAFVQSQYQALTGHQGDQAGVSYWVGQIQQTGIPKESTLFANTVSGKQKAGQTP